ncbi:MAG TPA: peptide deformylase [Opitutaceae bacterium]|nr:peptide deformylase [Opitutaceae bacterium]
MSLTIVHYNHPVLRKKGAKVTVFNAELTELAAQMVEAMHTAHGIGLAAQQIGQALQLCVIDLRATDRDFDWELDGAKPPLDLFMPLTLVNPQVKVLPSEETVYEEGCLSFPDIRGDIVRPDEITVTFQDAQGTPHSMTCNGLLSRCVQHEVDHLNGVLFIDRMAKKIRGAVDKPIRELAKKTREESESVKS